MVIMVMLADLATGVSAEESMPDRGMAEEAARLPLETPSATASPHPPSLPTSQTITGRDGAPMAVIPPGTYVMGSQDGDADEAPLHAVYLD